MQFTSFALFDWAVEITTCTDCQLNIAFRWRHFSCVLLLCNCKVHLKHGALLPKADIFFRIICMSVKHTRPSGTNFNTKLKKRKGAALRVGGIKGIKHRYATWHGFGYTVSPSTKWISPVTSLQVQHKHECTPFTSIFMLNKYTPELWERDQIIQQIWTFQLHGHVSSSPLALLQNQLQLPHNTLANTSHTQTCLMRASIAAYLFCVEQMVYIHCIIIYVKDKDSSIDYLYSPCWIKPIKIYFLKLTNQ